MNNIRALSFYLCGLLTLILYAFWLYWPLDTVLIQAHDFLDSGFLYFIERSRIEGFFFNPDKELARFMDLPLNALAVRDLGLGELYYELLSPSGALVANALVTLFVGFTGFFLLIHNYVLKDKDRIAALAIVLIMALIFAMLPFKPQRLSGIAMLPLLFWAALNIFHGRYLLLSFLSFGFYPFVAFLHYNGFAVAIALLCFTGFLTIKRHPRALAFIALTAFTGVIYCLVEYRSLLIVLHPDYMIDSHRLLDAQAIFPDLTDRAVWYDLFKRMILATGHHHMITDLFILSILSYLMFIVLAGYMFFKRLNWTDTYGSSVIDARMIALLVLFAGPVLGFVNFWDSSLHILKNTVGIPLPLRRLDSFALPLLFVVLTSVFLSLLPARIKVLKICPLFLGAFLGLIVLATFATHRHHRFAIKADMGLPKDFSTTQMIKGALGKISPEEQEDITLRKFKMKPLNDLMYTEAEYFYHEAFVDINVAVEEALGPQSSYNVMSVGLSPTVAQYHGYHTIDGYFANYSTSKFYKNFWPVIAPEVALDGKTKEDILPGGRIYAYLAAQHFDRGVIYPKYNLCAFWDNGGRALFSGYKIGNAKESGLKLLVNSGGLFVYGLDSRPRCPLNQSHD